MNYEAQIPVRSDPNAVLNESARQLISCGFQIQSQNDNEVRLASKGMRSTNQNPILGASEITLRQSHTARGQVAVSADLGGVRWLRNFVLYFPPLLMASISTILFIVMMFVMPNAPRGLMFKLIAGLIFMSFLHSCISAILIPRLRRNTESAIDACVRNADELLQREA